MRFCVTYVTMANDNDLESNASCKQYQAAYDTFDSKTAACNCKH